MKKREKAATTGKTARICEEIVRGGQKHRGEDSGSDAEGKAHENIESRDHRHNGQKRSHLPAEVIDPEDLHHHRMIARGPHRAVVVGSLLTEEVPRVALIYLACYVEVGSLIPYERIAPAVQITDVECKERPTQGHHHQRFPPVEAKPDSQAR
jgi:hypothetical protein